MKLLTVELQNFKYHKSIKLNCQGSNLLVYGENGAGKTSIYKAIYSVLYYHKDKKARSGDFRDQHINKSFVAENLAVDIKFEEPDKTIKTINRTEGSVQGGKIIKAAPKTSGKLYEMYPESNANIFMFEARDLDALLEGRFNEQISRHFGSEFEFEVIYRDLTVLLSSGKENTQSESEYQKVLRDLKLELDKIYKQKIESLIEEEEVNKILTKKFHWQDEVVFNVEASEIDFSSHPYKFSPPKVKLYLEGDAQETDVTDYLNEAKLKVLALAVYLCGILKQPTKETNILVLDDFVNSLDMANRRFIVDALLSNLANYQLLIFTHNIHFYELIKRVIRNFSKISNWSFQKLVDFSEGADFVHDRGSYLEQAKERLYNGDFEASANYLRKQFELICHRQEELLNLGRREELSVLLDELKHGGEFYTTPNKLINDLIKIFNKFNKATHGNLSSAHKGFAKEFNNKVESMKFVKGENTRLLKEITLMKDILLNPASHSNQSIPIHKSECEYAYRLLEKITNSLNSATK